MKNDPKHAPSKWFLKFFRWYCNPDYAEDLEGDLLERFEQKANQKNIRSAKTGFVFDVLKLFRPGIIRPLHSSKNFNEFGMFKNYFTIASRNLLNQKLYSIINIGGLMIGLTCFVMIFLYVQHELSYDNFYTKKDSIYQVYQQQIGNEYMGSDYFSVTPAGLASVLMETYPEVENATTMVERQALLTIGNSPYLSTGLWADPNFFEIFDYPFKEGNSEKIFDQPTAIVLTKSFANKVFGNIPALGKTVMITDHYGDKDFIVTGVLEDLPKNSSLQFEYVANLQSNSEYNEAVASPTWNNNNYHTFFLLKPQADPITLQKKLPAIVEKYIEVNEDYHFKYTYYIRPLSELYLQTNSNFDIGLKGNIQYLVLFSCIAIIVLLLACVNYMNLAIARSIQRAKEVGLRKVSGAVRGQLIGQFLGESVFIALIALFLAIGLTYWLLPYFSAIIERPLTLELINNPGLLLVLSLVVLFVGLFSGSYPAFFMSALKPINTLKGKITSGSPKMKLQSGLVVLQFATSIILIISSLVIYLQFDFIQNKELGYDKDHILVVQTRSKEVRKSIEPIKQAMLAQTNIKRITTFNSLPSDIGSSSLARNKEDGNDEENIAIYQNTVDYDYLKTFGLKLVAGRNFSPEIESDKDKVIINESAAYAFGWTPEEAVGNQFYRVGQKYLEVIGVVKDFHMFAMHLKIQPLMISLRNDYFNFVAMKVEPNGLQNTIALVEDTFQKYSHYPFEYQFMDDEFDRLYKADIKLGKIFGVFTLLSIIVAALGLFGLAAYITKQRTKEIGIRKVLGASIQRIVTLLVRDFLIMVFVGFVLAVPIAWGIMNIWLENYAYRITLEWWIFVIAGILAAIVSLVTISSQSIKASMSNPVDSLRSE